MKCKKCGAEFTPTTKLVNYCTWQCRQSRPQSEQANAARRAAMTRRWELMTPTERQELATRRRSKFHPESRAIAFRETARRKRAAKTWEQLGYDGKRLRVIEEQGGRCNRCNIDVWMDQPITLEIDHIDGNRTNNARENLEGLCPNCHSVTPTWRGRNKPSRNGTHLVSDEDLIAALRETPNIRQALLRVGLAAKGANYERAKRLKE